MQPGVYRAKKKNGEIYFRSSITMRGKHISLGSFLTEDDAAGAYREARRIYEDASIDLLNYNTTISLLSHDKVVTLINHRDHGIYIKTPIYLRSGYFSYFLDGIGELKFDNDDLFYYSSHRILLHDGHLYVNDYGMQYGILQRYGIKNFAVAGKDYRFANGDPTDFRYQNIIVINKYHGVTREMRKETPFFLARVHINGEFLIGRFPSDAIAAVAYNKAVNAAEDAGIAKNFIHNYVIEYSPEEYRRMYEQIALPGKYLRYLDDVKRVR